MKTYFTYKEKRIRIARDSGADQDRCTQEELIRFLENGDAIVEGQFIILAQTNAIIGVFEPEVKKDITYEIEHCAHCPMRSAEMCFMNTYKKVLQNFYDKTMHEECPLNQNNIVVKKK